MDGDIISDILDGILVTLLIIIIFSWILVPAFSYILPIIKGVIQQFN